MKKLLVTFSIIFSCIYLMSASNNPTNSTLTLLPYETSFVIDFEAFEGGVYFISIEDKSGKIIFTDDIESNKQRIKYVLDYLPNDVYTVKVKGDDLVEYYMINISDEAIKLLGVGRYSSPIIVSQANRIILKTNNDNQEKISLTIYNDSEEIIYSYSETHEGPYQKGFNLGQLANGNYRVLVSNDQFTKEVSIEL